MRSQNQKYSQRFQSFAAIGSIALLAVLVGCDASKTGTQNGRETGSGSSASGQRQFVTVGTAPAGGAFAPVGNAIANVVDANKGDLNWVVSPQGTKGTQENIRKLESSEIEFAMANAAISYFATKGEGAWKKPHNVRAVATLSLIHI